MNQSDFWQNFVNKQVTFRYMRQELRFNLSQSLFSSADVDIGSRFLLRTIARNMEMASVSSMLDIGYDVGVLGRYSSWPKVLTLIVSCRKGAASILNSTVSATATVLLSSLVDQRTSPFFLLRFLKGNGRCYESLMLPCCHHAEWWHNYGGGDANGRFHPLNATKNNTQKQGGRKVKK